MAYVVADSDQMRGYSTLMKREALLADMYADFDGIRDVDTPNSIPNGILVKVTRLTGENSHKIPLLKELSGANGTGNQRARGTEEDQSVRFLTLYANQHFKTVSKVSYGPTYRNASWLKLASFTNQQLGTYMKQKRGRYVREALCQLYSSNLADSPTSLTQGFNPNIVFVDSGTATGLRPATYSPVIATYQTNIVAVDTAIGVPGADERLSIKALQNIERYAIDVKKIKPITVNDEECYVLSISGRQKNFLLDPTSTSSMFTLMKEADVRGKGNMAFKNTVYKFGKLLLVEDSRFPVCTINGGTVTFAYADAGDTDARVLTGGDTLWDVCILHGNEAVYQFITEDMKFKTDDDDYQRSGGIGAFVNEGFILTKYDDSTTPTASSIVQQYSMLVLAGSN